MVTRVLLRAFDLFVFTSLFITLCAIMMVYQTTTLLHLQYDMYRYFVFVFFSTLCSYNFHWFLTGHIEREAIRIRWTQRHRTLHLALFVIGLVGAGVSFFFFIRHWFWLGGAVVLTFLYSAPKLPWRSLGILKKIAVGKTIFLAFVWTYVTTFLPIAFSSTPFTIASLLFLLSRFFLVYAICVIFDYRDRDFDRREGIRSMITYFNESGINALFYGSLILFALPTLALYFYSFSVAVIIALLIPGLVTVWIYPIAKKNFSDYLYYFVLDGLMMLSAIFTTFLV